MDTLNSIWVLIQVAIGYNLVLPIVFYIGYLVKGKYTPIKKLSSFAFNDYAIIVTAYEQTDALPAAIASILDLKYNNYLVYIVADKCDISRLNFNDKRVIVLRPPQTLGSNTRSHFYAINNFKRDHSHLIILDADNLIEPGCLNEMNRFFDTGFEAIQGVRKAKNIETTYACLDAARDIYYHFFDGLVIFSLGSSATLAGSGMAFTTRLYRICLEHLDITGAGFDKVLQKEIVNRGYRIAFNENAIVYDEKTSRPDQLVRQRARWINTWFRYFWFGFKILWSGIRTFNVNKFLFGIVLLRPPLFIFLILSLLFVVVNLWVSKLALVLWTLSLVCFITGFFIAIIYFKPDKKIIRSLADIPKFVFLQVLSLLKSGKANKMSVATQHFSHKTLNELNQA